MSYRLLTPIYLREKVIKGFQRGGKLLGYPTANLSMDTLEPLLISLENGVYFGWCSLHGVAYKTVMSVGYNPHFGNEHRTLVRDPISNLTGTLVNTQV